MKEAIRRIIPGRFQNLRYAVVFFLCILLVIGIYFGLNTIRSRVSSIYFERAVIESNKENPNLESIEQNIITALRWHTDDRLYRALSTFYFTKAQAILNSKNEDQNRAANFQLAIEKSILEAMKATEKNSSNHENWIALGGVYEALVPAPFSVSGAFENAKTSYEKAHQLAPKKPEILLMLARLSIAHKDSSSARVYVQNAITLDERYVPAYALLSDIELSERNFSKALEVNKKAYMLAPEDPDILFRLGFIQYSLKDFKAASETLRKVTTLVPNYSNAEYFLGLSLYEVGSKQASLDVFNLIMKNNPGNPEIQKIIKNITSGRHPLYLIQDTKTAIY